MKRYLLYILDGLPWAILSCIFFSILQFRSNNCTFSSFDFFLLLLLFIFLGAPFYSYLTKKVKDDTKIDEKKNIEYSSINKFIIRTREGLLYGLGLFVVFFLLQVIDETNYLVNWTKILLPFILFLGIGGLFVAIIKIIIDK